MRKLLLGMALLASAQSAWSNCQDTTIVLRANNNPVGFTVSGATGTYDPDAAGAINAILRNCQEPTLTVRLNLDAALAVTLKDTVRLSNSIKINDRSGKSTGLTMNRFTTPPTGVLDTLFTLVDNTGAISPTLLTVATGNQVTVNGMGFARKLTGNNGHTVVIGGKGSQVIACHFWTADNTSQGTGALLDVVADSVLVERCLFRSPPEGRGRTTGIHTGSTASKVEIRANVFFSTGLQMAATGTFHVIANSFVGSRNEFNPIIIGSGISAVNNAVIMHNLFAPKIDTLPPISFSAATTSSDSILRNAWSRGKPNLPLAVVGNSLTGITLAGATGANVNVTLPRGFSNYGAASGDVKDYPLTQLRTDPLLNRKHPDFGKIYRVYLNGSWSGTPGISDIFSMTSGGRMYFPGFSSFLAGKPWVPNIKVGAFVDQDTLEVPSPLDTGAQGASLKFQRDTTSTSRIKMTQARIDANYYKATILPAFMYFFFDTTLSRLTASNDTNVLKNAPNSLQYVRKSWLGDDSLVTVPREVRNGRDIYVKMLHFRQSQQAAVQSNAVIATVTGFPSYPVNDLILKQDVASSNPQAGIVAFTVTRGTEIIDSVRLLTLTEGGQVVGTDVKAAGVTTSFIINIADKGNYLFQAVPVAKIGTTPKAGQPTPSVGPIPVRVLESDSVYVSLKTGTCAGAGGTSAAPFCGLDTALKIIAAKKGGTIFIVNGSPVMNLEDVVISSIGASDTSNLTITSVRFDENRPIIRGNTGSAITINRKNVTLRGFTIEMPVGSTAAALNVKASGCVIESNIFRAAAKGAVEGAAVNIEVGATAESRFVNNVIWGFTKNVLLTSSLSPNIRIMYNTFVDDSALANTGKTVGISSGTPDAAAIIANNYFSRVKTAIEGTFTKNTLTLDHNVYTVKSPVLQGHTDAGGLDSSSAVASADVWAAVYTVNLDNAFINVIDCNSQSPCNSIYAGSSSTDHNVTVTTDVFGRIRTNKKEVGAYEFAPKPASVLGVVSINPSLVAGTFKKFEFTVTGKNFDPHPDETDSLHVFWTLSDVTTSAGQVLANLPAIQKKDYPISKLSAGSFRDVADSITNENTKYYFYAVLSRNSGSRKLGFPYSDTIRSSVNLKFDSCVFDISKSACPSESGIFGLDTGTWKGKFESRLLLSEPITAGVVQPPSFNTVQDAKVFNLDLESPLPSMTFNTKVPGLGTPGSKQRAKWEVDMDTDPDLTGLELFLLPNEPTGMAKLVPNWTLDTTGEKTRLTFETSIDGPQTYAFGKVQTALEPGQIVSAIPTPPIYKFNDTGSVEHIPLKIKGSAFKTGNPLVLVSIIPAGTTVSPPTGSSLPKVISKTYHSRTLVLSSGYGGLSDSLRKARFHQHYHKAVAAEGNSTVPKGQKKPFVLDSMAQSDFAESTELIATDLAVASGTVGEIDISIPVGILFSDYARYADQKGKASRSIEIVFTSFDGGKISRTNAFIRTHFRDSNLQISEKGEQGEKGYKRSLNTSPKWNFFGYPWDEADTGSLARIVEKPTWNSDRMRIMRYKGSGTGAAGFTAYDGSNTAAMKYDSGMAIWSGSTDAYTPTTASGISLDYQPFNLDLAPGIWNDICLPFNFNIKWQDILDASGIPAASAPALWHYDSTGKWVPVLPSSTSPALPGSVLKPWDGYTVKPTGPITLKFPVLDESRSTTPVAKPAAGDGSWAMKVEAHNSTAAMELRIGRGAQESWFPEAPNVPGQDFRVALMRSSTAGEEKVSQHYQALGKDWQGHWPLRAKAEKGSGGISLRLAGGTREVPVWLVDALHGTAVPLSKEASIQVGADALETNDYHLVAGDQAYVDGILKGMVPLHMLALGNYPNPFSGSTLIRYALPAGFGKVRFDLKVRDFRGRTVWEKTIQGTNSLSYMWDGRDAANTALPAGVYSLSLGAQAEGKPAYRAVRGILKIH